MVCQAPNLVMIIGMGHDRGFMLVPDASFMRNVPAWFMFIMRSMPCMCEWSIGS